jgi:hypothetical protein
VAAAAAGSEELAERLFKKAWVAAVAAAEEGGDKDWPWCLGLNVVSRSVFRR